MTEQPAFPPPPYPPRPKTSKRGLVIAIAVTLLLSLGAGGAVGFLARNGEVDKAHAATTKAEKDAEAKAEQVEEADEAAAEALSAAQACADAGDLATDQMLTLLDAMDAMMDDLWYSAAEYLEDVNESSVITDITDCRTTVDGLDARENS